MSNRLILIPCHCHFQTVSFVYFSIIIQSTAKFFSTVPPKAAIILCEKLLKNHIKSCYWTFSDHHFLHFSTCYSCRTFIKIKHHPEEKQVNRCTALRNWKISEQRQSKRMDLESFNCTSREGFSRKIKSKVINWENTLVF